MGLGVGGTPWHPPLTHLISSTTMSISLANENDKLGCTGMKYDNPMDL